MLDDKTVKEAIEADLEHLAAIGVEEFTLLRKWQEIHDKQWTAKELELLYNVKAGLWIPESPEDYLKLQPQVIVANAKPHADVWNILRVMTSTASWNHSPGRLGRYTVIDRPTGKYLGIISLGSDFIAIGGRDKYIGWSKDQRIGTPKRLNYTAMGSTIVPSQPFGFNYTGGKLISLLVLSDTIENDWNSRYPNERLAGVSTTSLWGQVSQYTRLKYWRKCESTEGQIPLEPSGNSYQLIRTWMKENYPTDMKRLESKKEDGGIPTHPKARIISFVMTKLKVKPRHNNFSRGVFFAELYTKTKEFLREESPELGDKLFDNRVEVLTDLWKEKYAKKRIENVVSSGRYNTDTLFYDALRELSWEECKERYLGDVGR